MFFRQPRYIALIRAILNRAMREWEWIDNIPYFSMYSEPKKRVRWLTPDEAKRLIAAAPPYMAQMIKFNLATGLRQRNVLMLKWPQVDLEHRVAWYSQTTSKLKCVVSPCRIIYTVFGKPPVSLLKLFDYITAMK